MTDCIKKTNGIVFDWVTAPHSGPPMQARPTARHFPSGFPTSLFFVVVVGVAVYDTVGVVSPGLVLHGLGEPLALGVGMVPEVEEEQQEDEPVEADDVDEDRELVGAVLQKEILADVCGHHHKLDL